LPLASVISRV
jgi:F-box interacting protein